MNLPHRNLSPGFQQRPVLSIVFSLGAYLGCLYVAVMAPRILAGGVLGFVMLTPVLMLLLVVGIIYFVYRASDDYIRQRILKCVALTGVILAFSTLGYFCLERVGYPPLSMIVVNLYGWSVFTVLLLWVLCRTR